MAIEILSSDGDRALPEKMTPIEALLHRTAPVGAVITTMSDVEHEAIAERMREATKEGFAEDAKAREESIIASHYVRLG